MDPVTDAANTPPTDTQDDEPVSIVTAWLDDDEALRIPDTPWGRSLYDALRDLAARPVPAATHTGARDALTAARVAHEWPVETDDGFDFTRCSCGATPQYSPGGANDSLWLAQHCDQAQVDAVLATATHTYPAIQALRDAAEDIVRELICCTAEDPCREGANGICHWSRCARALVLDRAERLEREAPAPTLGQRTVQVVVYTDEPGPDVTEVEGLYDTVQPVVQRVKGGWASGMSGLRTWAHFAGQRSALVPVGTRARLRGDDRG